MSDAEVINILKFRAKESIKVKKVINNVLQGDKQEPLGGSVSGEVRW